MSAPEFTSFGKIARLSGDMTITEKIDGTNAAVVITENGEIYAQSRKRFIKPGDDNYGFASWVTQHSDELVNLGPGVHFGEWWGKGIQRGYGLDERRFSLFNVDRWTEDRPACCHVVPTLTVGPFSTEAVSLVAEWLLDNGSVAAPGFDRPEGVMVWLHRPRLMLKQPFEQGPKGEQVAT